MEKQKMNKHRKLMWSALGAFAFAVVATSAIGSGGFDSLKAQVDGFDDGNGGYCEYTAYDSYGPICQVCTNADGTERQEECWGTADGGGSYNGGSGGGGYYNGGSGGGGSYQYGDVNCYENSYNGDILYDTYVSANSGDWRQVDDATCAGLNTGDIKTSDGKHYTWQDYNGNYSSISPDGSGSSSGSGSGNYECKSSQENGEQCNTCYKDGVQVSRECWDNDPSTSTGTDGKGNTCYYYDQSPDGSGCKSCTSDSTGEFAYGECWGSDAKIFPIDKDGNPLDGTGGPDPADDPYVEKYKCENIEKNGEKCNVCYDNKGSETSRECRAVEDKKKDDKKKDDKKTDEKRCEKYSGSDNEECEVCYDNKGKETSRWCKDPNASDSSDNNSGSKDPKSVSCSRENSDGQECDVCYEDGKEISRECSDRHNDNKADGSDVKKSLNDMSKNLRNFKTQEFDRIVKDAERVEKDLNKMLERMEKEGLESGGVKADVDKVLSSISDIVSDAKSVKSDLESMKSNLESRISGFDSDNTTWEEIESLWSESRKMDVYWVLNETLRMRLMVEERYRGFLEMKMQISRLKSEMQVSSDVEKELDDLLDFINSVGDSRDEMKDLYESMSDKAAEIQNLSDNDGINDAMEDMRDEMDDLRYEQEDSNWETQEKMENGWDIIDNAWRSGSNKQFLGDMEEEIDMIKQELKDVSALIDLLLDHKNSDVKEAAAELSKLVTEADQGLEDMKAYIAEGAVEEEVFHEMWRILEDIGHESDRWMSVFFEHESELSSEAKDLLTKLDHGFEDDRGPKKGKNRDDFKKIYNSVDDADVDRLVEKIKAEVIDEVMRQVSSELMTKLAPYIGEDVIAQVLNGINIMGSKGETLLSDSTAVYETMDQVEDSGLTEDLRNLKKETKGTLIVSSLKKEFKAKWAEVQTAADSDDKDAMKSLAAEIKGLLAKNDELSVSGDESYRYKDTKPDQWFFVYVYQLTEDGAVSGYKNADGTSTGEYRPTNSLTIAEAAKMAVNGCGVDSVSGNPPTPWMEKNSGHWLVKEGFGAKVDAVGIAGLLDMNNLNRSASREEVAVMIAQACKLDTKKGNTAFSDYSGKFGGHVQATYDAGIFTGQGDTGAFEGSKSINRAEMSKVVGKAIEIASSKNVVGKLGDLKKVLKK